MDRTTVTCIDSDITVGADVLDKSDRFLKVAMDGTTTAIELYKDTPNDRVYIGYMFGMEFTSEGD